MSPEGGAQCRYTQLSAASAGHAFNLVNRGLQLGRCADAQVARDSR